MIEADRQKIFEGDYDTIRDTLVRMEKFEQIVKLVKACEDERKYTGSNRINPLMWEKVRELLQDL